MISSIVNIISTVALISSLHTGDPSAGKIPSKLVNKVGVQQIKEGNDYAKLISFEKKADEKSAQKFNWPHVLAPEPAPATKPTLVQQPVHKVITVRASAYIAHCSEGCTGKTATGINLDANPNIKLIAVDPSVIPLGKHVYIEGYGNAITGDTGGGIKGSHIDIYMARQQDALNWGVRIVNLTILD